MAKKIENGGAPGTALAQRKEVYPILAADASVGQLMRENLGGSNFTAFDLERITIPTGGGTAWKLTTLTGEESMPALSGIIVHYQDCRAYWKEEFSGETPPDCASEDGRTGVGAPGGRCADCPYAQFGSDAKGGKGQACKQIRRVFLLRPKTFLPLMLTLPPTSIKNCKQYFTRVTNAGLPYWGVVTEIGLEKTKNAGGIAYSKTTFRCATTPDGKLAMLDAAESAKVREYATALKEVLKARGFSAEEFVVGGESDAQS